MEKASFVLQKMEGINASKSLYHRMLRYLICYHHWMMLCHPSRARLVVPVHFDYPGLGLVAGVPFSVVSSIVLYSFPLIKASLACFLFLKKFQSLLYKVCLTS